MENSPETINDNKIPRHAAKRKRHISLSPVDIGILILSSLLVNIFSLAVPLVTLQVYDRILAFHSEATLQVLCVGVFAIVALDMVTRMSRSSIIAWASARFEHAAYRGALKHIMSAKLRSLRRLSPAEQLHKLGSVAKLKNFYNGQALTSIIDLPFVLVFLTFVYYLSGSLVLVPLVLLTFFALYTALLGYSMKKTLWLRDKDEDQRVNFISELLSKIHTIKMLGLDAAIQRHHEALKGKYVKNSFVLNARNSQSNNAATMFTQIMMVSMISFGSLMVVNGQITMGVLIACVLLSGRIMQPVQRTLSFWVSFQDYRLAKQKMEELFALPIQEKRPLSELTTPQGKLEISNLDFSFAPGSQDLILSDINLRIAPGKAIALTGASGNGKTTFLKLITGLHSPDRGRILIDGMEATTIDSSQIAKYIGYLPPEEDIFQGTIIENLTSFRPELTNQAKEIATYLGIDKVISKLPSGYDTLLFDGPADSITPGVKQRITIARVLVDRPRLLLFDFADQSLDIEGYNHLLSLLGKIKRQVSMILVSNDENILHLAQDKYVLEDGHLIASEKSPFKDTQGPSSLPLGELRS